MPNINGIDYSAIDSINGISKNSITQISGVSFSPAPSCIPLKLGFSDGRNTPPEDSCVAEPFFYEFNPTLGVLYMEGDCGGKPAPQGFYSDGETIFFFDGISFVPWGACKR